MPTARQTRLPKSCKILSILSKERNSFSRESWCQFSNHKPIRGNPRPSVAKRTSKIAFRSYRSPRISWIYLLSTTSPASQSALICEICGQHSQFPVLRPPRLRGESQFSFHRRDAEIAKNFKLPDCLFAAQPRGWLISCFPDEKIRGNPRQSVAAFRIGNSGNQVGFE